VVFTERLLAKSFILVLFFWNRFLMMEFTPLTLQLFEVTPGNRVLLNANPPHYTIIAVSDGFLQSAPLPKEKIIGKGVFEAFPPSSNPGDQGANQLKASLDTVVSQKRPHDFPPQRYDVENAEGVFEERYWKAVNTPLLDEKGEVTYIIHSTEEITDRMMAERLEKERSRLSGENTYLQEIINIVNSPLQVLEPVFEGDTIIDFRFKMTNAAYAAYANTTPEALLNKRVGEVFPGYFQTTSFTNVVKTYLTGKADTWDLYYNQDGLDIYNTMSATRMDGDVLVHFTDYTKMKNLQEQLERKVIELERSNQNLQEFAYAASHDMKEPIRKIHFFADRLKERLVHKLEQEDLRYFERLETGTKRMNTLIDDLLVYSHVTRGASTVETVDLNQMLSFVLDDLELHIEQIGATVKVDPMPTIMGRPRQLQQLFENLIGNALKYSREGVAPLILITTGVLKGRDAGAPAAAVSADKDYHLIQVQDNGIGFEQKDAERIFTVFTRLHGNKEYRGTGVGLSIAQKVVQNHGGYIWAESKPGEGTIFKVLLPVN
jgi:signal transduction histidine kinase